MTDVFWQNKKVIVTGGTGFVGSFLVEALLQRGAHVSITTQSGRTTSLPLSSLKKTTVFQGDLTDSDFAQESIKGQQIVLHAASFKKNIRFHKEHPAEILKINTQINLNVLEAVRVNKINSFVLISSRLVENENIYSEHYPHYGYAWSKYFSEVAAKSYALQYGLNLTIARPQNIYGPRDNFSKEEGQVIPALIHRILSGENPLTLWGDGNQINSFLFVEDFVEDLLDMVNKPKGLVPISWDTSKITVRELANIIVGLVNKNNLSIISEIPSLQDPIGKNMELGFQKSLLHNKKTAHSLSQGLVKTIKWYQEHK